MSQAVKKLQTWKAHPGSQQLLFSCPLVEILLEGTRAGGKSDALIVDYLQGVGKGWGKHYRGIIFRNEYKHLEDIINKSHILVPMVSPTAKYKKSATELKWVFPDGEELLFRHAKTKKDYMSFHGHEIPWQGYEELTNWHDLDFYDLMKSTCRSPIPGIRKRRIATTNPFGIGHNHVKSRFIDCGPPNSIINDEHGVRTYIHSNIVENPNIYINDPEYVDYLKNIKDENIRKAWFYGDWNIVAGGAVDDLWNEQNHVIDLRKVHIPDHWRKTRSMDWGSSAPFSVGWWATSPGESIPWYNGERYLPKGTKIRIAEWYGAKKGANNVGLRMVNKKIAEGIKERENAHGWKVKPGGADSAMWSDSSGEHKSIHDIFVANGIRFEKAPKGPGSPVTGLALLRDRLEASNNVDLEQPGIYVGSNCLEFRRQIPLLPRDEKDYERVDTACEDHLYDEVRYELQHEELISKGLRI